MQLNRCSASVPFRSAPVRKSTKWLFGIGVEPTSLATSGIWQVMHILLSFVIGTSPSRLCGMSGGAFSKLRSIFEAAPGASSLYLKSGREFLFCTDSSTLFIKPKLSASIEAVLSAANSAAQHARAKPKTIFFIFSLLIY